MESDGIREPSRPGIREDWRPRFGCREGGVERKSKMILVWTVGRNFDQERRQGEKHVLRERWNVQFQTLGHPGGEEWILPTPCVRGHVWLFVTPWTVALQAALFMGLPRQDYWRRLPFPPPGDLPDPGLGHDWACMGEGHHTSTRLHFSALHIWNAWCLKLDFPYFS